MRTPSRDFGFIFFIAMTFFIALSGGVILEMCSSSNSKPQSVGLQQTEWGKKIKKEIWYYKDWQADVCYSMCGRPNWNTFSHAAVPCTEKVMALIVNKRETGCHESCDKTKKTLLPERGE